MKHPNIISVKSKCILNITSVYKLRYINSVPAGYIPILFVVRRQVTSLRHGERPHEAVLVLDLGVFILYHISTCVYSRLPLSDNPGPRHTKLRTGA